MKLNARRLSTRNPARVICGANTSKKARAWLFLKWLKMVFILLLRFRDVSDREHVHTLSRKQLSPEI